MYFNSQFFPQFGQGGVAGMMGGAVSHPGTGTSVQHSMNMLYMDSIQRQEHCSSGKTRSFELLAADSSSICPNVVVCLLLSVVGSQVEKSLLTAC